jgi:hypothetical protein
MNYDKITIENFDDYLKDLFSGNLFQVDNFISNNSEFDYDTEESTIDFGKIDFDKPNSTIDFTDIDPDILEVLRGEKKLIKSKEINLLSYLITDIKIKKVIKFSYDNDIFFDHCSFNVFENTFESRFLDFQKKFIDVDKNEFIAKEFEIVINNELTGIKYLNDENQKIVSTQKTKKIDFLHLLTNGIELNIIRNEPFYRKKYKVEIKKNLPPIIENINEVENDKPIPYKIALLNEIGFFELDKIKKLSKENQFKIIQKLTSGTPRTIKGNVNVLNKNSNEDRTKYTSNNYTDEVKIYLDKLK